MGVFYQKPKKFGFKQAYRFIKTVCQTRYDLVVDLRSKGLLDLLRAKHKLHKLTNRKSMHMHSVEKHFATIQTFLPSVAMPATKLYI